MRLGDLDALKEGLKYHFYPTDQEYETDRQWAVGYNAGLNRALHSIAYAKTIDAVPVAQLREMLSNLESKCCGDGAETYTTGYRNGHRNGQIELLRYIFQVPDGTSEEERKDGEG